MDGPEAAEGRDEPRQGFVGLWWAEGFGQAPHPTLPGHVVEQRLEQLGPRAETLVDRGAGDTRAPGDGVEAERARAGRHEERARRLEDPGARAVHPRLATAQMVRAGG